MSLTVSFKLTKLGSPLTGSKVVISSYAPPIIYGSPKQAEAGYRNTLYSDATGSVYFNGVPTTTISASTYKVSYSDSGADNLQTFSNLPNKIFYIKIPTGISGSVNGFNYYINTTGSL